MHVCVQFWFKHMFACANHKQSIFQHKIADAYHLPPITSSYIIDITIIAVGIVSKMEDI